MHRPEEAEKSLRTLERFHAALNRDDLLPERAFRRNVVEYDLVCHVNNIVALFISENFGPMPLLVARAFEHMAQHPASAELTRYYETVHKYLRQIVYHLKSFVGATEWDEERIPADALRAGPQAIP